MSDNNIEFRISRLSDESVELFRFRYEICEDELGLGDDYADHEKRTIQDPLDDFAHFVCAYKNGKMIGTARVNFCTEGDPGYYRDFYELEGVGGDYPDKVSFSTRIMVDRKHRRGLLPLLISVECFRLGIQKNVRWCFCGCRLDILPFFLKLGYDLINPEKNHRNYGPTAVLRFDLNDPKHYDKKKSLFARYLSPPGNN